MNIKVSRQKSNEGLLTCRHATVREKLINFLLGSPVKLTVLVPGNTVEEIAITEVTSDSKTYQIPDNGHGNHEAPCEHNS